MEDARRVALALFFVSAIVACSGAPIHVQARPGGFPDEVLAGRRSAGSVAIANVQNAGVASVGSTDTGRPLTGDLSQWTNVAVQVLAEELTASGMVVTDASARSLRLAVTNAEVGVTGGGFAFKCRVTLRVESGDGVHSAFVGERASWSYLKVCDAGISEAVANMLRDETVLAYLGY
jgi:hypothetical protein